MKSKFLISAFIFNLMVIHSAKAEESSTIDPNIVDDIRRQPLSEPFPQVDPLTGVAVSDDTEITVPSGKKMKAKDYYSNLNAYQAYLNERGYSLKGKADPGTIARVLNNINLLNEQKQVVKKDHKEPDPAIMDYLEDPDLLYEKLSSAGKSGIRDKLKALYLDIINRGDDLPKISAPEPPARVVTEATEDLRTVTNKQWTLSQGEPEKFAASGSASLQVLASLKHISGLVDGHASVSVLSHGIPLIDGVVKGDAALDTDATAEVSLEFIGSEVFRKTWKDRGIKIASKKESSPPPMSIRRGQKFRFNVGPVPMSGEVGAAGQIGYDWAIGVSDKSGGVSAVAYSDVSGYAQVGADIEIASAGVGGELILLRDVLKIEGTMGLEVDASGAPRIETSVKGTNKLVVLAGELYAYVRAFVPTLGTPAFDEKQWNWELFKWAGLDTGGEKTLFNFGKVVDNKGYSLTGAPTEIDYQEVNLDNALTEIFRETMKGIEQEGDTVTRAGNEIIGTAEALRRDLKAWLEGLDA